MTCRSRHYFSIHIDEDERDHGQTRYTRTYIFRQWAAVLMRGICKICKHMGIRPLDIQSPIPTVEWIGREGRANCEEDRNEGNGIRSRPLHRSTGVSYDAYFGLRKVTCTAVDELTFEIYSTFDTGLATTCPGESRGYSTALRREDLTIFNKIASKEHLRWQ